MRVAVLAVFLAASSSSLLEAGQSARPGAQGQAADSIAEAYTQFMMAHRLEEDNNIDGAIAAYKRAIALDPQAADILAELADLYLRQNRGPDALAASEQALKIAPGNPDAHRVLGTVYASMATSQPRGQRSSPEAQRENLTKSIDHLEKAIVGRVARADANLRAMLSRLYIASGQFDKANPMLSELVKQEPQWEDGATMLVEAYSAADREDEAVKFLQEQVEENSELLPTLADLYANQRKWREAADTYQLAVQGSPRSFDLRVRWASVLLNTGSKEDVATARTALREALAMRGTDERALYLSSVAERRSGNLEEAESAARKLMAQNARNPNGFVALAETLEERRQYQAVVDALAPAMGTLRSAPNSARALAMLLPHLGFAYQQVGQFDKAITTFEEARKVSPRDPSITGYLISAQMSARNFGAAAELARQARTQDPDNLGLARLEAQALRQSGKPTRRSRCSKVRAKAAGRSGCVIALADPTAMPAAVRRPSRSCRMLRRSFERVVDLVRARRRVREAEEIRGVGGGVPAAHRQAARPRRRAQLPRLHAGGTRRTAGRISRTDSACPQDRSGQRLVSGQPGLGVFQEREIRSRGGAFEARRRSTDDQFRRAGSLR